MAAAKGSSEAKSLRRSHPRKAIAGSAQPPLG